MRFPRFGRLGHLVALAAITCSFVVGPPGPPPVAAQTGPATNKLIVDNSDGAAQNALRAGGAVKLVDYGSFALWRTSDGLKQSLAARPSVAAPVDFDAIHLRSGSISPVQTEPAVPTSLQQQVSGPRLGMVQFVGPIKPEWLTEVKATGLRIVQYVPNNSYVVFGDDVAFGRLQALRTKSPSLQWSGAFHPYYRLEPSLAAVQGDGLTDITVQILTTKTTDQTVAQLLNLSAGILVPAWEILDYTNISVQVPARVLGQIAHWPDVVNIERWVAPRKLDEVQNQIVAGNVISSSGAIVPMAPGYLAWLASKGFPTTPASYPVVAVVDDGVDTGVITNVVDFHLHEFGQTANPSRLMFHANCTADATARGTGGHGHLNAGIVGGYNDRSGSPHIDGNGYNLGLGVAPYARLANIKIFNDAGSYNDSQCSNSVTGIVAKAYLSGTTFTSNSWGAAAGGAYNSTAQAYDTMTRDAHAGTTGNQQMLHIFANGNSGSGANTVGSPATAKNVLSVGATENVRDDGVDDGCGYAGANNADDLATFSSRGPTDDGRVKPEIVAPGTHVQGPASTASSYDGSGVCGGTAPDTRFYPTGQITYTWSSGTSHSTPAVAGAAALAYEYYGRVLQPGQTPSPAMLKALLINSARYLNGSSTGGTLPSNDQGWGDANLGVLFDGSARLFLDQSLVFSSTGQTYFTTGLVSDSTKPFVVTLAWTDAAGATVGNSYNNNLDLEVTVGGQAYKGNVLSGRFSAGGGNADAKNNVEQVIVPEGTTGPWSVRVIARNLNSDAIPGEGTATDQDFALMVSNGAAAATPTLARANSVIAEIAGNGDSIHDLNERRSLLTAYRNDGNASATDVTGSLSVVAGMATILTPTVAFGTIAPSSVVTGLNPYGFRISPDMTCGGAVTVREVVTYRNAGEVYTATNETSISIGSFVPIGSSFSSYSGGPVTIPDVDLTGVLVPITVTAPLTSLVGVVSVTVRISHTWDSDVVLTLISPAGTEVLLVDDRGGSGDNFITTTFADSATTPISSGSPPFNGAYRPESPLSTLLAQPISGTWRLRAADDEEIDIGTLTLFDLAIEARQWFCSPFADVPGVTWPAPGSIVAGTALGPIQLNATAEVTGTFIYTPAAGTILPPGPNQPLLVTFMPGNPAFYQTVDVSTQITVLMTQTITFGPLANRTLGDPPFTVTATASSGLTPTIQASPPTVCTINGTQVTLTGAGTCTLVATQGGNSLIAPADPVTQTLQVASVASPSPSPTSTPTSTPIPGATATPPSATATPRPPATPTPPGGNPGPGPSTFVVVAPGVGASAP